jgi:hypothetical protein
MSDKEEKRYSSTVFIEGESAVTTSSPYEKFREAEFEYISKENQISIGQSAKKNLRLECINLALMISVNTSSNDDIIDRAKRFYEYVKSGK